MDWYTTWQDAAAIGLAVVFLLFAFWLSRRVERGGCAACPAKGHGHEGDGPQATAKAVRLERLSLSRRTHPR